MVTKKEWYEFFEDVHGIPKETIREFLEDVKNE